DDRDKLVQHNYDEQTKGTTFAAGGSATLAALSSDSAKGNVTLTGSTLATGAGAANLVATGDVTLNEGREEHDSYSERHSERGSFVKKTTTDQMQNAQTNLSVASTVSGDSVAISAGHDVTIKGATVAGTNDVNIAAANNVTITTTQDTQTSSNYYHEHTSGISQSGVGVSVGSRDQKDTNHDAQVINHGSTVGSLDGNLNIKAGNDLHVTGSDLIAAKDVTGMGANVTIDSAVDTAHHDEQHEVKQSGFTIAVKAPVIDAVSNTVDQARAGSQSQDDRAAALHGIAAASGAVD
ncbi:hemagglutinin repeat-containing protein, partial [Caballeronia ptereochthonis]|uniref:hemagglutinin repeat-containing protein n=1 Tax=Caballeronia ptereochthonis TaxID=1777144 RepID=UPI000A4EF138